MHLTQRVVDGLPPVDRTKITYDERIKGFGVRQTRPSVNFSQGARSFIFEYRPHNSRRGADKCRITLGSVADMTATEARALATKARADIRNGIDPAAERRAKREESTLAEAYTEYQSVWMPRLKPRTREGYESIWRLHLSPALGRKRLSEITPREVMALYQRIAEVDEYPIVARRMIAVFKAFWNKLSSLDPQFNLPCPARAIKLGKEKSRERFLSPDEITRLGAAITMAETEGIPWTERKWKKGTPRAEHRVTRISANTASALRMLIFTGARLREVLNLSWGEVDLDRGMLHLKDSKTGRKTLVLSGASLAILQATRDRLDEAPDSDCPVFPEPGSDKPRHDLHRPWTLVCRAAGLDAVRLHDLRHSVASLAVQSGLSLPAIGAMLGHKTMQATARYAHLDVSSQRRAVDLVAGHIERAMIGGPANVRN
jgi:integrase